MFFKKDEAVKEPDAEEKEAVKIDDFKEFCDVGQTFNYLGVELIVEKHWARDWKIEHRGGMAFPDLIPYKRARMRAAYRNDHGELKWVYFDHSDLSVLRAENA